MNFASYVFAAVMGLVLLVLIASGLHLIVPVWWGGKALWMPGLAVIVLALASPLAYFFSKWWLAHRTLRLSSIVIGATVGLTQSLIVTPLALAASFPLHRYVVAPCLEAAGIESIVASIVASALISHVAVLFGSMGAIFYAASAD